jgi:hypothetical protein
MTKAIACALIFTAMFAGCARMRGGEPSASPAVTNHPATPNPQSDEVSCKMSGGKWNVTTLACER